MDIAPKHKEVKFSHFLMKQCLNIRRFSLLTALLIYFVFAAMDMIKFSSDVYTITLTSRVILVILPLLYLNFIYWFRPPESIRTNVLLILMVYLGSGLNHSLIVYFSQINDLYFSDLGIILILMFGCLLFILPNKPAGIITLIILSVFSAVHLYLDQSVGQLIFVLIILTFVSGICLTINKIGQNTLYQNYLLINQLYHESITDGLTQLNNRRAFKEQIDRLSAIAIRHQVSLGLILIDADYFKVINDSFGHKVGDDVLKKLANIINAKCKRTEDMGFRIGGDEFALILYGVNEEKLAETCQAIVTEVASLNLKVNIKKVNTSVSLGAILKSKKSKISGESLVELADIYLYEAKEKGRNQYQMQTFK